MEATYPSKLSNKVILVSVTTIKTNTAWMKRFNCPSVFVVQHSLSSPPDINISMTCTGYYHASTTNLHDR